MAKSDAAIAPWPAEAAPPPIDHLPIAALSWQQKNGARPGGRPCPQQRRLVAHHQRHIRQRDGLGPVRLLLDGREDAEDTLNYRVMRGGGWYDFDTCDRSANRNRLIPSGSDGAIGFRCA
jgi:formylglycine-generating enzyme required for sulfatase activity